DRVGEATHHLHVDRIGGARARDGDEQDAVAGPRVNAHRLASAACMANQLSRTFYLLIFPASFRSMPWTRSIARGTLYLDSNPLTWFRSSSAFVSSLTVTRA